MSNIVYCSFYIYLLQKHCSNMAKRELPIHPLPPEGHEPSSDSRAQHGPVSRNRPQGRSHIRANSRLHPASWSAWEHLCSLSQAAQHSCWRSNHRTRLCCCCPCRPAELLCSCREKQRVCTQREVVPNKLCGDGSSSSCSTQLLPGRAGTLAGSSSLVHARSEDTVTRSQIYTWPHLDLVKSLVGVVWRQNLPSTVADGPSTTQRETTSLRGTAAPRRADFLLAVPWTWLYNTHPPTLKTQLGHTRLS